MLYQLSYLSKVGRLYMSEGPCVKCDVPNCDKPNTVNTMNNDPANQQKKVRQQWDEAAANFDNEPDHGLQDAHVQAAWHDLLMRLMPMPPAHILDIGCGTGSLALLLSQMGHDVIGSDFSVQMLTYARYKLTSAGYSLNWLQMDAAHPALGKTQFDVVLCRHVLWALPQPQYVLQRWQSLLRPGGRMVLIEGYWHTKAGLHASDLLAMLPDGMESTTYFLSDNAALWDNTVSDERYAIVAI